MVDNMNQVVVFTMGNEKFGFLIEKVNEIIRYIAPTKIPESTTYVEGIISLRGEIHTIIDLHQFFAMCGAGLCNTIDERGNDDKVIIVTDSKMGFVVDDVTMIVSPKSDQVKATDNLSVYIDKKLVEYILEIDKQLIIVLNMQEILDMHKVDNPIRSNLVVS
jgi:purine-binding chemotaxis protein CheW